MVVRNFEAKELEGRIVKGSADPQQDVLLTTVLSWKMRPVPTEGSREVNCNMN
jgi:hypothetical protein